LHKEQLIQRRCIISFIIKGPNGNSVGVSSNNRLKTKAVSTSQQHFISHHDGLAYQASGEITIGTSDVPVLYLENNDSARDLVITYIRFQSIGAAVASETAYFTVSLSDSYTSGGDAVVPTQMNRSSPNVADAVCYDGNSSLTISGGVEIDKNYEANSMQSYNKEGTIILPKGQSISIWHKGSTVAGTAYARFSFFYDHATGGSD